jgi:hypothetical protein
MVIAILAPIHLFAQFWYHTRHIGKMGWLEYVLVTPSQHRVHHAINPEYIDKNLGQILCVWDRWFGTFQEELDEVPPQFGVLKPAGTWNPIVINFQHLWRIMQDAWRTRSLRDKLRIWFMPTGWRPDDVKGTYPIAIIEDVYNFKRYASNATKGLKLYAIFQMLISLGLMMFMFYNYTEIGFEGLLIFSGYIFIGIYGYTTLMDRKKYAVGIEFIRGLAGILWIVYFGDWFGINAYLPMANMWIGAYFLITIFAAIYFSYFENKETELGIAA